MPKLNSYICIYDIAGDISVVTIAIYLLYSHYISQSLLVLCPIHQTIGISLRIMTKAIVINPPRLTIIESAVSIILAISSHDIPMISPQNDGLNPHLLVTINHSKEPPSYMFVESTLYPLTKDIS